MTEDLDTKLDKIDKRIIYQLSLDSRNSTTTEIANKMNVSPGTVRNRLNKLERKNVIKGYHANINYEKTGKNLITLIKGSIPIDKQNEIIKKILNLPEVINVRKIITGSIDVHIMAVSQDTRSTNQITKKINKYGVEIVEEDLIQEEHFSPYQPFGPKDHKNDSIIGLKKISGNIETINITVNKNSPVTNKSLKEIKDKDLIGDEVLIIAIERENKVITPKGDTKIKPNDIITILSPKGVSNTDIEVFKNKKN